MNTAAALGGALTLAGLVGYLAGVLAPYPGRAFSVTGVMVGITLLAIGRGDRSRGGSSEGGDSQGSESQGGDSA